MNSIFFVVGRWLRFLLHLEVGEVFVGHEMCHIFSRRSSFRPRQKLQSCLWDYRWQKFFGASDWHKNGNFKLRWFSVFNCDFMQGLKKLTEGQLWHLHMPVWFSCRSFMHHNSTIEWRNKRRTLRLLASFLCCCLQTRRITKGALFIQIPTNEIRKRDEWDEKLRPNPRRLLPKPPRFIFVWIIFFAATVIQFYHNRQRIKSPNYARVYRKTIRFQLIAENRLRRWKH